MAGGTNNSADAGWIGCNVDFGDDQSLEVDYRSAGAPSVIVGSGIAAANVWFKGLNGLPDVRFRIERTEHGLQVGLDRGDQSDVWWAVDSSPRLGVAFDNRAGTVTAFAAVGLGDEFQEVDLGTTAF